MNILVVDDEPLIHISIEKLILSCCDGAAVFHAYNGRQMLDILPEHDFALAYVDIKMPGISGLEALRQAREISPFTSYYIMTGFDEFEYAKQAIKLKVDDYLMKPLDLKTIRETTEAANLCQQKNLEHKKQVFRNWLESTLNQRESSFQEYTGHYCALMLVNVDDPDMPNETIQKPFSGYEDHLVSIFTPDGLLLLGYSETFDYLHTMFKEMAAVNWPKGISSFGSSITNIADELKTFLPSITEYSHLRVILGSGRFYHLAPLLHTSPQLLEFCGRCVQWQEAYLQKDYTAFTNLSELLCIQCKALEDYLRYADSVCSFFSLVLGVDVPVSSDGDSLKALFRQSARELLTTPAADSKVQPIIQFIQEHYQENLSAADLSERFGFSANYISNLLKTALGIRYNDYVTQLRLNLAKKLLVSTHQSVKEITAACGYFSQSHFTKLFLEHEGCTPSEYRKRNS